jgi:hypothetical protein
MAKEEKPLTIKLVFALTVQVKNIANMVLTRVANVTIAIRVSVHLLNIQRNEQVAVIVTADRDDELGLSVAGFGRIKKHTSKKP